MRAGWLHDHHYTHQALEYLHLALSTHVVPPHGHAYYRLLHDAMRYFREALPQHMREEEAMLYPRLAAALGQAEVDALHAEHNELLAQAAAFAGRLEYPIDAAAWETLRRLGARFEAALQAHLAHEEAAERAARATPS